MHKKQLCQAFVFTSFPDYRYVMEALLPEKKFRYSPDLYVLRSFKSKNNVFAELVLNVGESHVG